MRIFLEKNVGEIAQAIKENPKAKFLGVLYEDDANLEPKKRPHNGLIDSGHSLPVSGARSKDGSVREEYMTIFQANLLRTLLGEEGFSVDIFDSPSDDLAEIGYRAEGYSFFVSLHFNSYEGSGDPGTEVLIDNDKGSAESLRLANLICSEISTALGSTNRGVKRQSLMVLDRAEQVCTGPCVLVESFFLNPYDVNTARAKAKEAASAICRAVVAYFG